ncbi:hypothetical protein LCM20_09085 [Halobacillus litoralis]|uniref:hypothetical protein n=1 Tax=Halobacillus litoralis TaxID=45668 RepID=UPI001CD72F9F|nr:hypothetical protein [Halobacillus litoralis]MCA0970741.1 hypothetical protein [Halobacillus litoralis]
MTKTRVDYKSGEGLSDSGEWLEPTDYQSLASFTEEEYTGVSFSSPLDGMGMVHETYAEEMDALLTEWMQEQKREAIADIVVTDQYVDDILLELEGNELFSELEEALKARVESADVSYLLKLGERKVQEDLWVELEESERQQEKERQNKTLAGAYWNRVCNLHKLKDRRKMPEMVDEPYFDTYIAPLLKKDIIENGKAKAVHLLGTYQPHSFSNAVVRKLKQFDV